jgi:hypothetical protein
MGHQAIIRKWIKEELKDFLKEHEYKFSPIHGLYGIVKRNETNVNYCVIHQDSMDYLHYANPQISFATVEEIMFKVTHKGQFESDSTTVSIMAPPEALGIGATISSVEDAKKLTDIFKKYFVEAYLPAFEKYSTPESVLTLWDSLETMEEKAAWFPSDGNAIKILIFSKMCNEDKYEQRRDETLEFYKNQLMNGDKEEFEQYPLLLIAYKNQLKWCEEVIEYLAKNEI